MGTPVYYFGDFCLNPLTRELSRHGEPVALAASAFDCLVYLVEHRERPVGRDELISAVWGRADVSDNLLAQTIVRLRRALGDGGAGQQCIKTVARVGYRWMLDVTVAPSTTDTPQAEPPHAMAADDTDMDRVRSPRVRRSLMVALLLTIALAVAYAVWQIGSVRPAPASLHFAQGTAIVLPADVNAPQDWEWLHLGLMDLLSTRLRDAKIPTENSQEVLNMLAQPGASAELASFALVVTPRVALSDNHWHVHLDAKAKDGRSWQAESSSGDVLAAARAASDLLLAQLGFNGSSNSQVSSVSQQEYLLRIEAAQLAGQPALAHQLIDSAPPELRRTPELAFAQAELYCDEGKLDPCEQSLTELRKQVSATANPVLRGKVLTALWFPYRRKNQLAEGEAALDEAVHLLQGHRDVEALGNAYLDRSHLLFFDGKLDEAAADLGRARVNFALAGDSVGQARVDFAMGMLAQGRDQYTASLPLMQKAYEQYQRMGMRQMLSSTLQGLAYAQKMQLQYSDELATTDRYWPFEQKHMDFLDDYVRHQLTYMRGMALADNGRTSEASALLEHMLTELNGKDDADLRAGVQAYLAGLALRREDLQAASSWIDKAMAGTTLSEDDDPRDYGEAWFTKIATLQRAGKADELKRAVADMQAWAARLPKRDALVSIWLMRAKAAEAWSEGQHEQALEQLKLAMATADTMGVPDIIVDVGHAYALTLLAAGHVDQAMAVSGRLSSWSSVDWRAAWVEASVLHALGQGALAEQARNKALRLAGDRVFPATLAATF
jgi:DNA-binding winged helix-turn-helix (wHTH) protein/tetratricopeptide (TPR) repeat protein